MAKNLPSSKVKEIKAKKDEPAEPQGEPVENFAKRANEMEQEHLDKLKATIISDVGPGFSVSQVIESIAKKSKPSTDDELKVHLKEDNMNVPEEKPPVDKVQIATDQKKVTVTEEKKAAPAPEEKKAPAPSKE